MGRDDADAADEGAEAAGEGAEASAEAAAVERGVGRGEVRRKKASERRVLSSEDLLLVGVEDDGSSDGLRVEPAFSAPRVFDMVVVCDRR